VERKALQNHPTLYYDDGNLILSCGSTLFRVHRSVLSKHSPVFRTLFERDEDTKTETLRGCLHVALDDTKEEIEALLNVIYDGFRIDFPELTVVNFPTLANIFRMATKYRIDRARKDILDRLKEEWPFALTRHDAKCDARTQAVLRVQQQRQQAPNAAADPNANAAFLEQEEFAVPPASVIALLRNGGSADKELLAPLFYALSCSTWQFGGPAVGHHIAPLSHADIERFIVGLEQVRTVFSTIVATRPTKNLLGAHAATNCEAGVATFWQSVPVVLLFSQNAIRARRPIEALKDVLTWARGPNLATFGVCATCAGLIAAHVERERSALWDKIPALFGLA